jgi:2-methylcitrate dehydratase PrpD
MIAESIATWVEGYSPSETDLQLAQRSLIDTLAVTLGARSHPLRRLLDAESEATRWAAIGHVLDFDDLHVESTSHVSVVCVAATLASGGDARAYLTGAGVMARLGSALGWQHYEAGWHATCTVGCFAAAVCASVACGLSPAEVAHALALAVPAAGGVQRAFGTDAKSLQVGFAVDAGLRAARLVRAGARADPTALDAWFALLEGDPSVLDLSGPSIPGGLALKLFPCCYALQRPIVATRELVREGLTTEMVDEVIVRTPAATIQPLIHHRPTTALEGKFSLEYGIAASILDEYPGFVSFSDDAVRRAAADELISRVRVEAAAGGSSLLSGTFQIEVRCADGSIREAALGAPPGVPGGPSVEEAFSEKLRACGDDVPELLSIVTWESAPQMLRRELATSDLRAPGSHTK